MASAGAKGREKSEKGRVTVARPGPVLVTGANSGFGLATALRLAQRGWEVWGTVRGPAKAERLTEAATEAGVGLQVRPLDLDVSDHTAVVDAWKDLPDFYGVVNNAGYAEMGPVEEVSAERARAQLDVNLIAPAVVSACALPGMRRRGRGRIVMVSSIAGRAAVMPLGAWYHASKFGLEALSDVLRVEVASFGVRVAIVEPGFFKTGIGSATRERVSRREEHADSPYASAYRRTSAMLDLAERFAPPASLVARTIVSAVESRRPLRRYLIGLDAVSAVATQAIVPRSFIDTAMRLVADLSTRSADVVDPEPRPRPRRKRAPRKR
jgi:NAD(P)-dependent dehydrogenase (short-subunit alcohol dehydrogenase family)